MPTQNDTTTTALRRGPVDIPDPRTPIRRTADEVATRRAAERAPRLAPDEEIGGSFPIGDERAEPPAENGKADDELPPLGSRTLTQIHAKLCKPFPLWAVEVKPGATTQDKTRALALAYVDARVYQTRLDRLAGPEGWQVEYRPISDRSVLCRLTVLGVTREDVGECDTKDPNATTSAAMQAFKRACAAFGMGRYLYGLPQPWCAYDAQRKRFADPSEAVEQIYRMAGLLDKERS